MARDRLREELTLVQIDRDSTQLEELDVGGIPAFAERVLVKASELWVHASLDQRQRLQPGGCAVGGNALVDPP
jgi:hypothetical protein